MKFHRAPELLNKRRRPGTRPLMVSISELVKATEDWRRAHKARVECGRRLGLG